MCKQASDWLTEQDCICEFVCMGCGVGQVFIEAGEGTSPSTPKVDQGHRNVLFIGEFSHPALWVPTNPHLCQCSRPRGGGQRGDVR